MSNKKVHFITYSDGNSRVTGLPYSKTQKLMVESVKDKTSYEVVLHTHTLETIKSKEWFKEIEPLIKIDKYFKRAGYYLAWKPYLIKEVLFNSNEGDIVYYSDSSAYHIEPFLYNLDNFFKYVDYNGHICGSIGNNFPHSRCSMKDQHVFKNVHNGLNNNWPNIVSEELVLDTWISFKNIEINRKFVSEWVDLVMNTEITGEPLVTEYHPVEQCITSMLRYKYGFKSFFNDTIHDTNKQFNYVHKILSNEEFDNISELDKFFVKNDNYK